MASIFSQGGYLYVNVMIPDEYGKKKRKKISTGLKDTPQNLKIAEKKYLKQVEESIFMGVLKIPKKSMTVKMLGEEYIKEKRQFKDIREYTIDDYEASLIQHIYPKIGMKSIESITTDDIDYILKDLHSKYSMKRASNIRIPFKAIFDKAKKKNLIQINPFENAIKTSMRTGKKEALKHAIEIGEKISGDHDDLLCKDIDPFSEEEIQILLNICEEGQLKNYIALSFLTGLRPSELIALEWTRVDIEKKYLLVWGAITGKQTEEEKIMNKSKSSIRKVYLSNSAIEVFKKQFDLTYEKKGHVFLTQYGQHYKSAQSLADSFKKLLEKAKIRDRRLYDLRHSFASINLSENRLPLLFVSKQLGHKNAVITLNRYSTYIKNSEEETLEMLNRAFDFFSF